MLRADTRVHVHGLRSRPELNGTVAVVLAPDTDDERRHLEHEGRVKITAFPRPIAVKPACLTPVDEAAHRTDWTVVDLPQGSLSVLELARHTTLGKLDVCDEFVGTLLRELTRGTPVPRSSFVRPDSYDAFLNNTAVHAMYFCHFDQCGHHLVVETQGGKARVFMSQVRAPLTVDALVGPHTTVPASVRITGYTAAEWAAPQPQPHWPASYVAAHRRWGGGRELSRAELRKLLDLLFALQDYAGRLADVLVPQLPAPVLAQDDDETSVVSFSRDVIHNPSGISIAPAADGGATVFSNGAHRGLPFTLNVPGHLLQPFSEAMVQLTGQEPAPYVYMQCVHYQRWATAAAPNELTGALEPVGWAVACVTLPH